jgi:hypothetical protein
MDQTHFQLVFPTVASRGLVEYPRTKSRHENQITGHTGWMQWVTNGMAVTGSGVAINVLEVLHVIINRISCSSCTFLR